MTTLGFEPQVGAAWQQARHEAEADLVSVTVPTEARPQTAGFSAAFHTPHAQNLCFGEAWVLTADGPHRFDRIRRQAEAVRIHHVGPRPGPVPRWWGGFSFEPHQEDPVAFPAARFVMPRVWWHESAGECFLTVTGPASGQLPEGLPETSSPLNGAVVAPAVHLEDDGSAPYWQATASVVQALRSGRVNKVVLSRVLRYRTTASVDSLFRMAEPETGHHARFCFRSGPEAWLGVTPERLVAVEPQTRTLRTEALAGSAPREQAHRLERDKEQREHRMVLDGVLQALDRLGVPAEAGRTEVSALRRIAHLRTPVLGHASPHTHVLSAVSALHPTAATAGTPREAAMEVIGQAELHRRGWYCGAVGWFDRDGAGDFRVALRSMRWATGTLHLPVGGGWVHGSDPQSEFAETELKAAAVRAAFGLRAKGHAT